ncbi:MAG: glycosyltransferase family 4 protein [Candidatus Omnitrophica bacterium]|nr:glycosyltransferase family 4 protein [Candidatus Omnitrophota bacterium]
MKTFGRGDRGRTICFFVCPHVLGGLETLAFTLAQSLDPARYRPVFLFPWSNPAVSRYAPGSIVVPPSRQPIHPRMLGRHLRSGGIDLVQSFGHLETGAMAARWAGIPHLWHLGGFPGKGESVEGLALLGRRLVVPSHPLREHFERLACFDVSTIPAGVDLENLESSSCSDAAGLRQRLRFPEEAWVVGMVGNFYLAKQHPDFLKAGALLCRADSRVRLVLAGRCFEAPASLRQESQRYRESLIRLAARLGVRERLRIVSFTPQNRWRFFRGIDVLLAPSVEGFGLATAEAMAAGRPVVSVNRGGVCDLIEDNISGRWVPLRNPRRMAEAALEILENRALARRLGAAASRRIRCRFTVSLQAKRYQALYDRILEDNGAGSHPTAPFASAATFLEDKRNGSVRRNAASKDSQRFPLKVEIG